VTNILLTKLLIRGMVEDWALWRDTGQWDRFRTLWHPEGTMVATWRQGTVEEFIRSSMEGFARGVRILHMLGGSAVDVEGDRAIAQTRFTISQRAPVEGVICDVVCHARSFDFIEQREGRWGILRRETIYEKDRIDAVDPKQTPDLDAELLNQFPEGYRHLAYLQTKIGYKVRTDMPGVTGPALEDLLSRGRGWLRGEPATA